MKLKKSMRFLALLLAFVLASSSVTPATVHATEVTDEVTAEPEVIVEDTDAEASEETTEVEVTEEDAQTEASEETSEEAVQPEEYAEAAELAEDDDLSVSDFETFLKDLKVLEGYARTYSRENAGQDEIELVLNYVRTGVERYRDGSWGVLAGEENRAFTAYVKEQDEKNGTQARALRTLNMFEIPNGDTVEFEHMFGTMNITYYMARTNPSAAIPNADLGGWAGDLADLMQYTVNRVKEVEVDKLTQEIYDYYLLLDEDADGESGFGRLDIYGDLDAYYIMNNLSGNKTLSKVMENYFTKGLTEAKRAEFFLKNRFPDAVTKADIREAMFEAYTSNEFLKSLEASKGLKDCDNLRQACINAFADYIHSLTGDMNKYESNKYYTVFDTTSSTLAPGVKQQINYATTADGKQIVYYIATSDVTRDDVSVHANYMDNQGEIWGYQRVMDHVDAAVKNHTDPKSDRYIPNYTPVVATNGDFYNMTTGEPRGALVMEGTTYHTGNGFNFFAILKDGTPIIADGSEWSKYQDQVQEALGGADWLVKDGKSVKEGAINQRASRTCVGITADNKVVMMVVDGRQEPRSAGADYPELAQIMLDAGCVDAINLDGGGSTTYAAKEEGSDKIDVINTPSDGFARSVSSSLMVVSTAKPSTEFDHAIVSSEYAYMTPGTTLDIEVTGVSGSGGAADLPKGSEVKVSNPEVAELQDGKLTALKEGDFAVQVVADGKVVGQKAFHVVIPDTIAFERESINAIYGVPTEIPVKGSYNGNKVAVTPADLTLTLNYPNAGTLDGFTFTGDEASGVRSVFVTATMVSNKTVKAYAQITLYREDEAMFDFDDATFGDRQLAVKREVTNASTVNDMTYFIDDMEKDVTASYIMAIDMQEIEIPEILQPLVGMLPGGDDPSMRAWNFMLQLAERFSPMTKVTATLEVDEDFELDYSNLKLVNEYFELKEVKFDEETNTLTVSANWIDQTAAIDASTANSMCIISGLKFIPKEGTDPVLDTTMKCKVDYTVYFRANAVYNLATDPEQQQLYQIYPYVDGDEKGGYFTNTFNQFEDNFVIDRSGKEGWVKDKDGNVSYYEDNKALTGIQKLPGYLEEGKEFYYDLGEDGISKGKVKGFFEMNGATYYGVDGTLKTGWLTLDENGKSNNYYFDKDGKAVDGEQKIGGYNYVFKDHVLVRGEFVKDANGIKYMWGGSWVSQKWFELDGDYYYAKWGGYLATGFETLGTLENGDYKQHAFDKDGKWLKDYTGTFDDGGNTYYVKDGFKVHHAGLVKIGKDYYYFNSSDVAIKNRTYWVSETNGLLPAGNYTFDADGKIIFDNEAEDPNPGYEPEETTIRISGKDRYLTSTKIADAYKDILGIEKFDTVIVASGENFADALSGSYLSYKFSAPMLLTPKKNFTNINAYLKDNLKEGGKVYILGGGGAVDLSFENGLGAYEVERLSGKTRYDTNLAILKEAGVTNEELLISNGQSPYDSLSASATKKPILLVDKASALSATQVEYLKSYTGTKMYILGGTGAVKENVEAELKTYCADITRISGKTRYETSVKVAETFCKNPEAGVLAYGENFPDGLCGGTLAIALNAPLILTVQKSAAPAAAYMEAVDVHSGVVLGGPKWVTDKAVRTIFGLSNKVQIPVI